MQSIAQLFDLALRHHQVGQFHQAELIYRQILQVDPQNADAIHLLGLIAHQVGRHDMAVDYIQKAVRLRPDFPAAYSNMGNALRSLGRLDQAAASFREALRQQPDFADGYFNLGLVLQDQGKLNEAIHNCRQAVALKPEFAAAHNNLGNLLKDTDQLDEAIVSYRQALRVDPNYAGAHSNLGNALRDQRKLDEAIIHCRQALRLQPNLAAAHNNLGNALRDKGQRDPAAACYREAMRLQPDFPDAYNNLGNVLRELGKVDESIVYCKRALEIRPTFAAAHSGLGVALQDQGKLEEAIACYHEALRLQPQFADAHNNLGSALTEAGQFEEGLRSVQDAIRVKPDFPGAHFNRAAQLLIQGNFEEGWEEYEWRLRREELAPLVSSGAAPSRPFWDGTPLQGETILLRSEQGLGDALQFVRYAPILKDKGAGKVVVECPPELRRLMARCPGVDAVVGDPPLPAIDVQAFLLSLPRLLGTNSIERIPASVPYLECDPELVERWQTRLAESETERPALRVGIVWQGFPGHRRDHFRSVRLERFAPLAEHKGVRLVSLQKGHGSEQLDRMPSLALNLGPELSDMADTAAVIRCLDLVITVDTAVAHLAGALGAPVWVLLHTVPDWRWMLERRTAPGIPRCGCFARQHGVNGKTYLAK